MNTNDHGMAQDIGGIPRAGADGGNLSRPSPGGWARHTGPVPRASPTIPWATPATGTSGCSIWPTYAISAQGARKHASRPISPQ